MHRPLSCTSQPDEIDESSLHSTRVHVAYEHPVARFRVQFCSIGGREARSLTSAPLCTTHDVWASCQEMIETVNRASVLAGDVTLPADKSIAHRTALLSALGDGTSEIIGYPDANDPQSTLTCLRGLGIEVEPDDRSILVHGTGLDGLQRPTRDLD